MSSRFIPILLLSLALAATVTSAQEKQKPPEKTQPSQKEPATQAPAQGRDAEAKNPYVERFNQLDRNRDGHVSLGEWPMDEASFKLVDRNQDGRLSRHELLTPNVMRRDRLEERFQFLDLDRDGRLNRTERQRGGPGLDRMDRNADGYVTPLEYRSQAANVWNPLATVRDQQLFQNLDRNRDNRLSRPEWTGGGADFDRLDLNRDGLISPNEWP
jgi:hypothetical protein